MRPSIVSVCIPVYNGAAFIAAAVESVLAQTFHDFELIILDNASTDQTADILSRFKDERLRIVRHPSNIGATANFNAALSEARGVWVKILCADDLLYPDCLEKQMAAAGSPDSRPVLLCAARDIINARGRRLMSRRFPGAAGWMPGCDAIRRSIRAGTNLLGEPAAVLMHRETALNVGGFDPAWRFCTDLDLWVRILQYGDLYVDPAVLCAFRVSTQSWSIALVRSQAKEFCRWMTQRQNDGLLRTVWIDRQAGRMKAYLLMIQRRIFYRVVNRGRAK
ncbi:MAG: glycosyltransferase [Kiritimatiellales bacterium]|nr:glycosyltransferase [Kiritimatiellales bacterium]